MMNAKKNPIMITKSFLPPIEEYKKEIERIWETNWLTNMGPIHQEFKLKLKKYLKCENISLFVNGHQSLEIALKSLELKEGGEVITTPFTFASTTHAIVNCGFKPVFCDIELDTYNIDFEKIEKLITEKTVAIVPVHVFGNPCNVKKVEEIAKKYNIKVLYDAAHTFGVEIDGKGIGSFGDISMFSLHATKVFHSIEGGILTYRDETLGKNLKNLKNFGITGPEEVVTVGGNSKMNEFQAAMGIVNLRYVDKEIKSREKVAEKYRDGLKDISGIRFLKDIPGVRHNYAYFPILVNEEKFGITRDELHDKLKEYNIFTRKYFYPIITEYECYRSKYKTENLKNSKYVGERILTLPMYGSLNIEDIDYILESIKKCQLV